MDAAGNLYGTTYAGGRVAALNSVCENGGCGTVFELIPGAEGHWTEKLLHSFAGSPDGANPMAGLIFDASGNLYGTTLWGGTTGARNCFGGCGTVFEISPTQGGTWQEKTIHSFNGTDGTFPAGGLIFDAVGNLYGTTSTNEDNSGSWGTVFELSPNAFGGWEEKTLHTFYGQRPQSDGGFHPLAELVFDSAGNLYGTTNEGGLDLVGVVFELVPNTGGEWEERVIHTFGSEKDGESPGSGLVFDASGNLYGTTELGGGNDGGGCDGGCGTVFELAPSANGSWREEILHRFSGLADGGVPKATPLLDGEGTLYGTAAGGGTHGDGTIFEITP
jgi:uncharacterized repeat protein (TIGR03803 family)